MFYKGLFLLLVLSAFFTVPLFSHPHMFIDSEVTIVFEEEELEGFRIKWSFDEMFTASIRTDYDFNRDGSFDKKEVRAIEENAFSNLKNYNYFITVISGEERYEVDRVEEFEAELVENRLVYRFFVPYRREVSKEENTLGLVIFDDTFYCDIAYESEEAVHIKGDGKVFAESRIRKNEDKAVDFDPAGGRKRGSGGGNSYADNDQGADYSSGTAYPHEIELTFKKE